MDRIQTLLKEIKSDNSIMSINYRSSLLNKVADIFEKYGFGAAEVFLIDKFKSDEHQQQAKALFKILRKFDNYQEIKLNRSIGRYIIKTLITLKKVGV